MAEVQVDQHAVRLERRGQLQHVVDGGTVGHLHLPAAGPQGELHAGGDEAMVLDDEDPPGHDATAFSRAGASRCSSTTDVPPPGRASTRIDPSCSSIRRCAT